MLYFENEIKTHGYVDRQTINIRHNTNTRSWDNTCKAIKNFFLFILWDCSNRNSGRGGREDLKGILILFLLL